MMLRYLIEKEFKQLKRNRSYLASSCCFPA